MEDDEDPDLDELLRDDPHESPDLDELLRDDPHESVQQSYHSNQHDHQDHDDQDLDLDELLADEPPPSRPSHHSKGLQSVKPRAVVPRGKVPSVHAQDVDLWAEKEAQACDPHSCVMLTHTEPRM